MFTTKYTGWKPFLRKTSSVRKKVIILNDISSMNRSRNLSSLRVCVFFFLRHRHQNYRFESLALVSLSVDKTCFGFVQLTSIPWRDSLQMIRMSKNFIFVIATVLFSRYHSAIYFYTFLKMYIPYSIFHTVTDNCSIHFQTPKSLWSVAES